jgi:DNA-binding response OmpR family regulator
MVPMLKTLRVLIVDDTPLMCTLLRGILLSAGVREVDAFSDPVHALRMFSEAAYDAVYVDWEMPTMSGIDFVKSLRDPAHSRNPYVPIIMVSAHAEPDRVLEARGAGIHEYLIKPITGRAVLERLEGVINNPRPFVRSDDYFGPALRPPLNAKSSAPT